MKILKFFDWKDICYCNSWLWGQSATALDIYLDYLQLQRLIVKIFCNWHTWLQKQQLISNCSTFFRFNVLLLMNKAGKKRFQLLQKWIQNLKKVGLLPIVDSQFPFIYLEDCSCQSSSQRGLVKETTLERADFTLQLLMFVTVKKKRYIFIVFFLSPVLVSCCPRNLKKG